LSCLSETSIEMNTGSGDEVMYESELRTAKKRVFTIVFCARIYIIVIHMGNKQEEGEICSSN